MSHPPFGPSGREPQSAGGIGFGHPGPAAYGWAATATPAPAPGEPTRPARARRVIGAIVTAALLCAAAGAVFLLMRNPPPADDDNPGITLLAPASLNGRPRLHDPEVDRLTEGLVQRLRASVPNTNGASGAAYGDRGRDLVLVITARKSIRDPAATLTEVVAEVDAGVQAITGMTDVDPGPLGGNASCGDVERVPVDITACIWADHGSIGLVFLYYRTSADAAAEFLTIRGTVEQPT